MWKFVIKQIFFNVRAIISRKIADQSISNSPTVEVALHINIKVSRSKDPNKGKSLKWRTLLINSLSFLCKFGTCEISKISWGQQGCKGLSQLPCTWINPSGRRQVTRGRGTPSACTAIFQCLIRMLSLLYVNYPNMSQAWGGFTQEAL